MTDEDIEWNSAAAIDETIIYINAYTNMCGFLLIGAMFSTCVVRLALFVCRTSHLEGCPFYECRSDRLSRIRKIS